MPNKNINSKNAVDNVSARQISVLIFLLSAGLMLALPFILSAGQTFILPIVAAAVIAIILSPVASAFEKIKTPSFLASFLAICMFTVSIIGGVTLILQPAINLVEQFPFIAATLTESFSDFNASVLPMSQYGEQLLLSFRESAQNEALDLSASMLQNIAIATPFIFLQFLLVILMCYLMLISRGQVKKKLLADRSGPSSTLKAARMVQQISASVSQYLGTVLLINLGFGLIVGLGAWAFGLTAPLMWGGLAALLNFVPYVGPLLFALFLAITGIIEGESLFLGLLPVAFYAGVQSIEANIITPSILGEKFSINPVMIVISISFFTWTWGFSGALLSVPLVIILKVLLRYTGSPNFVGFFLGEKLFDTKHNGT